MPNRVTVKHRDRRYSGAAWRDARVIVLERDGYLCRIRSKGCTTQATEVDHIVSPKGGGAFYDPSNLRASCRACNAARGIRTRLDQGWRLARTHVSVIRYGGRGPDDRARELTDRELELGAALVDSAELEQAVGSAALADIMRRTIVQAIRRGELADVDRVLVTCRPGEQIPPHHLDLDVTGPGPSGSSSRNWAG